jgi:hypothetical protein
MIFDRTLLLSDKQAITATAASTNIIDLGAVGTAFGHAAPLKRDLGLNQCIPFLIQATETFTAAGAATLTVALQADDDEAFGSPTTVWTSAAIPVASLVAGYQIGLVNYIPKGITERYFRLNYTVATGPMTAGRIIAGVVAAVQTNPL